jgi:prepilin-type processing-associated H-X9-DG protein
MKRFARWMALGVAAVATGTGLFPGGTGPLGASRTAAQEPAPVEAPPVTGQYVPEGAVATIVLHPRAFFSQRSMRLMPLEMIRATGEQQVGIDPLKIDQIKVVVGEIGPMGPTFGAVVQMADPVEIGDLNEDLVRTEEPVTIEGKEYYTVDGPPGVVLHQLDGRTGLVGMQPFLEQMLAASGDEPPLAPLLARMQARDHAMVMLAIEPIRPLLQGALDQQLQMVGPMLPESVQALREFPQLTDYILLRASVGDRFAAQLTLLASDEESAEQLENLLVAAMGDLRQAMVLQMQAGEFGDPEMADAQRRYTERMSQEIATMLTPVRAGRRLTITLQEDFPHVAMLGMMTGLSLPAIQGARGAAQRAQSSNHLKQIALAMHNYHDTYGGLPDPAIRDDEGKPLLSWRVALLPYLEQQPLYEQFRLDEPWDSEHNLALVEKMPDLFRHPASTAPPGHTVYQAIVGEEIGLRPEGQTRFQEIRDGLSNTIAVAEIEDEFAVPWTKPEDVEIDPEDPWGPIGGHHPEGANVMFLDGSVRMVPYWLEPAMLWALMTRAGGEVVPEF